MSKAGDDGGLMAAAGRRGRSPDDDETDLWRKVIEDVTPLRGRQPKAPAKAPAAGKGRGAATPPPGRTPAGPRLPELVPGAVAGLDKRTAARLRRGQLAIEARIDLHGLTREEAHRALDAFLQGSQAAGRRCVLVITGKGLSPDGSTGVLRRAVPRWLNEPPNRARVLAIAQAVPRDGGEGALYVLLRKGR